METISKINEKTIQNIIEYHNIGGQITLDEFNKLLKEEQQDIMEYLQEFTAYNDDFPEFIQLRVDEDKYGKIVNKMKTDFNLEKVVLHHLL